MPSAKLVEKRKEFKEKQARLAKVFEEAKVDGKLDLSKVKSLGEGKSVEDVLNEIHKGNEELNALHKEIDDLVKLDQAEFDQERREEYLSMMGGTHFPVGGGEPIKTFGQMFAEQLGGEHFVKHQAKNIDIQTKTLFERTAGWEPESTRSGRVVLDEQIPIQVIDILPTGPTSMDTYKFMEETTFTNNAAEVAEGGQYGEAALELTERSQVVEKIGVWLPVTDEQMEDVAGITTYVDGRLVFMIRQRLDSQLLQGDGVTPNILGFYNKPNIQTQAKGADPTPDAFFKAMTKIMVVGQANANYVIMHPYDWQEIRLLRTNDDVYIFGNPANPAPARLWGLPVLLAQAATEGTGLVGDFAGYSMFFTKRGVDVQVTNAHDDYFIKGKQAIRADMRGVLVIFRPTAFCTVTGI